MLTKNNILYYLSITIITLFISICIVFYFFQFYPFTIVTLKEFRVQQESVRAGETITLVMDFDKYWDYKADVRFSLVDGVSYPIPSANVHKAIGNTNNTKVIQIPKGISGIYHIEVLLTYKPTPIREINYVWKSNKFEIINSKNL